MSLYKDLVNTLVWKVKELLGIAYPQKILPKLDYQHRMTFDQFLSRDDAFVLRRSALDKGQSFNSAKKLKSKAITTDQIPLLSCNLLGGKFEEPHANFVAKIKSAADAPWEGQRVRISDYRGQYNKLKSIDPIFIPTNAIHDKLIPFQAENSKHNRQRVGKLPFEPVNGDGMKLNGVSKIIHSPTNINYWHVEVEVRDFDNKIVKKTTNEFNETACDFILDIISETAVMLLPAKIEKVDEELYSKWQ